jgi:outer membrane murein-binding lipoprotein Lpp
MTLPLAQLISAWQNKHTRWSAAMVILAKYGAMFLEPWFPGHFTQIDNSATAIEGAAVAYGILMSGAQNAQSKQELADVNSRLNATQDVLQTSGADTSRLARTETPPKP